MVRQLSQEFSHKTIVSTLLGFSFQKRPLSVDVICRFRKFARHLQKGFVQMYTYLKYISQLALSLLQIFCSFSLQVNRRGLVHSTDKQLEL